MGTNSQPTWRRAATHLLHTSFVLKARLEEALQAATGLLLADNEALLNLQAQPLRMSDIAERLILSRGGTTKVIDRLEQLGYVARSPDPTDRRAILVAITPEGDAVRAQAKRVIDAELESVWAIHLTEEEAATMIAVMDRVVRDAHTA